MKKINYIFTPTRYDLDKRAKVGRYFSHLFWGSGIILEESAQWFRILQTANEVRLIRSTPCTQNTSLLSKGLAWGLKS